MVFSSLPTLVLEKLKVRGDFWKNAASRDEIHPAEQTWTPPAFCLDDVDFARVERCAEYFSLEWDLARVRGGPSLVPAIMRYHFRDLLILGGDLFSLGVRRPYKHGKTHRFFVGTVPKMNRGFLASSQLGSLFFGHWLIDDLTLAQLATEADNRFFLAERMSPHQAQYLTMLGLEVPVLTQARIEDCTVVVDALVQSHKASRLRAIRCALQRFQGGSPSIPGVMILRKNTGNARVLLNEAQIADVLASHGFAILDPMNSTVAEIQALCCRAEVVVGVEGSHLTHALVSLRPNSAFLAIQPPFRFDNTCKSYADALGVKYGFTVGLRAPGGFTVDPERVWALVQKVGSAPLVKASFAED